MKSYSRSDLLKLQNKPCVCLSRKVRRRLVYHKIYNRHIATRVTSTEPDYHVRDAPVMRCLRVIPCEPQRKTRPCREVPALPSLLLSNVRSLNNKMDEATLLLTKLQPDLAAFTETWLDLSSSDDAVAINGYRILRRDRKATRGGGIICYIGENFNFKVITENDVPTLGSVSSEILALLCERLSSSFNLCLPRFLE